MRQPLIIANWKMNGCQTANARLLGDLLPRLNPIGGIKTALCPPFPYLVSVAERLSTSPVALGAQNVNAAEAGAYTGEVSPPMLRDLGCQYVLVGHSERRALYGESNADVAMKFEALLSASLTPVLCVGETLEERRLNQTSDVVSQQLEAVLEQVGIQGFKNAVIAYEPVWAIGTGQTATPEQAEEVHAAIREQLSELNRPIAQDLRIIYGGSVKGTNAEALFAQPNIDGGLVGGASLDAQEFATICRAAAN